MDEEWMFFNYSMTAPSNFDDVIAKRYGTIPSLEEFLFSNFAHYTFIKKNAIHLVVDDHLVTAQNKYSTLVAIQTFILLCNR
jgi:hypothetical protein